jgi:AraC-like DNA-binding protein
MGRPSLFRPEMAEALRGFIAQGYSLGDIATEFGVSRMTLHRWMRDNVTILRQPLKEAERAGRAERAASRAAEAERLYEDRYARNRHWLRLPPRPTAVDATAARATLDLLLKDIITKAGDTSREPQAPTAAGDEHARRRRERLAARTSPATPSSRPEEPEVRYDGDGEPVPFDDPLADW